MPLKPAKAAPQGKRWSQVDGRWKLVPKQQRTKRGATSSYQRTRTTNAMNSARVRKQKARKVNQKKR